MTCDVIQRVYDAHVEIVRPVTIRVGWRRVPVVLLLVIDEDRLFAGGVDQVAERVFGQRQPADEMRIRLERIVVVVEEDELRRAGEDDGVPGTGDFQPSSIPR